MKLKEYLKTHKHTQMSYIEQIEMATGVRVQQGTFAKWITGSRIPRKSEVIMLYKLTEGAVQPNDFYIGE